MLFRTLATLGFFFSITFYANASHFSAGHLTYRYIGDSTGTPREYLVELTIYRNLGGVQVGTNNVNATIVPATGPPIPLVLFFIPPNSFNRHPNDVNGRIVRSNFACAPTNQELSLYKYETTVILPPSPMIFNFITDLPCCRDRSDNLASSGDLTLTALLNRNLGENTLPKPVEGDFLASLCVGQEFNIGSLNLDRDAGDIIQFTSATPVSGTSGTSPLPMLFEPGLSASNPLPTDSLAGGYQVNQSNASVTFTPTTAGVYTLSFLVTNRRLDTTTQTFRIAGNYQFDLRLTVSPACDTSIAQEPRFSSQDTTTNSQTDSCTVQSLILRSKVPLDYNSLDSAGSNFEVYSLVRQAQDTLANVIPINRRFIQLNYKNPISQNDTLRIITKAAADSSKIASSCGFEKQTADTIFHIIQGCSGVALAEVESFDFYIYPNPAKETLELNYSQGVNIKAVTIMNLSGQVLRQYLGNPSSISLSGLAAGTYLLKVNSKHGASVIKKLIKN